MIHLSRSTGASVITLIGMAGAGKSTIGRALAKKLDADFVDTDAMVTERAGCSLPELVERLGTQGFRAFESETVATLSAESNTVIATGGSVVYEATAMQHLQSISTIVWLKASIDTIRQRIGDGKGRGLVKDQGKDLSDLFLEREPLYQKYCDIALPIDGLAIDQVARKILKLIDDF